MGELDLIREIRRTAPTHPWVTLGPGDDCALLNWAPDKGMAFKIDQIVEDTHFQLNGDAAAKPHEVGWKAMAKACSDVAAMGYWPVAATVAVHLPAYLDESWALALNEGICACCKRFDFALVGGDISSGTGKLSVVVSLLGEGPKADAALNESEGSWLRAGARIGDLLLVTGELGGSLVSRKHLNIQPRLHEARQLRNMAGPAIHGCIDITDGLARDLAHICDESECGAVLNEPHIPISAAAKERSKQSGRKPLEHALQDGEDFELLLAIEPDAGRELLKHWSHETSLTFIGTILDPTEGRWLDDGSGNRRPLPDVGWEHLTSWEP